MKNTHASILTMILVLVFAVPHVFAEVEWKIDTTFSLSETPLDTAASSNGKWIFILTDAGKINIYTVQGAHRETIDVGTDVDKIRTGSDPNIIYLQSRKKKTVEVLVLDFIMDFDLTGSPVKGPVDAPVTIVEFSDFQCAYCSRMTGQIDQILKNNPKTVKVVYKHFPLSSHHYAVKAAMASMAANEDGKFWDFHDQLFKNYNHLNDQKVEEIAQSLKFDKDEFNKRRNNPKLLEQIKRDYRQGIEAGVRGTPTLFVNGKMVRDRSVKGVQKMIDSALKKQKKP